MSLECYKLNKKKNYCSVINTFDNWGSSTPPIDRQYSDLKSHKLPEKIVGNPVPGFVIKTKRVSDDKEKSSKVFINVMHHSEVLDPTRSILKLSYHCETINEEDSHDSINNIPIPVLYFITNEANTIDKHSNKVSLFYLLVSSVYFEKQLSSKGVSIFSNRCVELMISVINLQFNDSISIYNFSLPKVKGNCKVPISVQISDRFEFHRSNFNLNQINHYPKYRRSFGSVSTSMNSTGKFDGFSPTPSKHRMHPLEAEEANTELFVTDNYSLISEVTMQNSYYDQTPHQSMALKSPSTQSKSTQNMSMYFSNLSSKNSPMTQMVS